MIFPGGIKVKLTLFSACKLTRLNKEKRSKKLIELSNENQKQYNQNLIGKDVEVLFEEKNKEGYYKGHTQNYILVEFTTDEEVENKIVKVNVKKAEIEYVIG